MLRTLIQRPPLRYCRLMSSKIVQFNLADIGEGITECELVQWYITKGQKIAQFDRLCEVQSDKATVEITSRYDGTVTKIYYDKGQMAKVGSPLVDIEVAGAVGDDAIERSENAKPEQQQAEMKQPEVTETVAKPDDVFSQDQSQVYTTPAVRRMAKELGVNLSSIKGSGKNGRIMKEDLSQSKNTQQKSWSAGSSAQSSVKVSQQSSSGVVQLSATQKAMVRSMKQSLEIPHFGFSDELSFLELSRVRSIWNAELKTNPQSISGVAVEKLSYMPFLLKSFSAALEKTPLLNAKFVDGDSQHLLYRGHHNIGVAIDSPSGLVVPNIKNVQSKSVLEIALELNKLTALAKKNQLPPDAFKDSTITISNIGNLGGRVLHPVIPHGTVCIVAIGRIQKLPRYKSDMELYADEIVTSSFSADHRVVDGASVARFFLEWKSLVEMPAKLLLKLK